jgi:DNA-binding HxlR family transcriptional regulator
MFAPPYNALDPRCPSRFVLTRIGDRWTALIVSLLDERPYRFGELRRTVEGISQKMRTQTLRGLEKDGLVRREVVSTRPISVDYSLTDLGRTLVAVVDVVVRWAEEHAAEVLEAHGQQA